MAAQVKRDEHKMRAFVRFTPVAGDLGTRYVAWYEPDHQIVRRAAPFFADRFSSLEWSILTPDLSAHWDTNRLTFATTVSRRRWRSVPEKSRTCGGCITRPCSIPRA